MNEQRKLKMYKGPYLRKADFPGYGTKNMMIDLMIALCPLIIFAWVKNGLLPFIESSSVNVYQMLYPLILVLFGTLCSYGIEVLYFWLVKKDKNPFKASLNSYSLIPGMLLAMIIPLHTPLWILFLGCLFGTLIAKLLFGGFGYNIFNPALTGYLFIMFAFYSVILSKGGYLNATEAVDIITGSTPLHDFQKVIGGSLTLDDLFNVHGNLWQFLWGFTSGSMAETSSILCLVSLIYLLVRKVINWRIPVVMLSTVFVITLIIGLFLGYGFDLRFALFNILSGGVMFAAVFMATEPVTCPKAPNGKIIYALLIGILTVMLRYLSGYPEGVSTSILFLNMFVPIIDNFAAKLRVNNNPTMVSLKYGIVGLLFILISIFTVSVMMSRYIPNAKITSLKQDYNVIGTGNIEFEYEIFIVKKKIVITGNIKGEITSDTSKLSDKEVEAIKKALASTNASIRSQYMGDVIGYISNFDSDSGIITASARGFAGDVFVTATIENNQIIHISYDVSHEPTLDRAASMAGITITDSTFFAIADGKSADVITGVSYTSVAVKAARDAIDDYLIYLSGGMANE